MNFCYLLRTLALALAAGTLVHASTFSSGGSSAGSIDPNTGVLRTWGSNVTGQLGHSPVRDRVAFPLPVPGNWKSIVYGTDFAVAIDSNDGLWAWGANATGQLGNGTLLASNVPAKINFPAGSSVRSVAAGQGFVVALVDVGSDLGRVYSWGANTLGQLGLGHQNVQTTPARQEHMVSAGVPRRYTQLTAGLNSALAIATDGTLWGWGYNLNNVLGSAPSINRSPIQIGSLNGWTEVRSGSLHVLALRGSQLFSWGSNSYGQLGKGTVGGVHSSPAQILSTVSISSIGVGDYHSFAITSTGTLYAWGFNFAGQLGLDNVGSQFSYATPQIVHSGLAPWASADGAFGFSLARTVAGVLYSFGANDFGQLGSGAIDAAGSASFNFVPQPPQLLGVNLSVTAPTVPGGITTLGAGTTISPISVTVQNLGQAALPGSFTVSLYLSLDPILGPSDVLLSAPRVESGPLAALATRQITFSSVALPEVPSGAWYILSQVSTESAIDPYQPDNSNSLLISLSGPDLTLDQLAFPTTQIPAGATFTAASLRLVNVGQGAVANGRSVVIEAFLSPTPTFVAGTAQLLSQREHTLGLAPAGSVVLPSWNLPIPSTQPAGAYFLLFFVNRSGAIAEAGSTPNLLTQPVTVTSFDLAVTAPSLAGGVAANNLGVNTTLASVSTVLQNQGNESYSGTATVELFLSSNATYDPSDLVLASTSVTSQVGLTSRAITWTSVAIPDVVPGEYSLLARINFGAGGADTLAGNNVAASPVTLKAPVLIIDGLNGIPTSVQTNGSFGNARYSLRNLGPGAIAVNREVEILVYLSRDQQVSPSNDVLLDRNFYSSPTTRLSPAASELVPLLPRELRVPQGSPNGIYHLLFVTNANGNVPGVGVAVTSMQVAVGSLDAVVEPISLALTGPLGVNTDLGIITVTTRNDGGFAIPPGMRVQLFLSRDSQIDEGDTQLAAPVLTTAEIVGGTRRDVSFTNVRIPNIGEGPHFLIAQITLPEGLQDNNFSNNVAVLPVVLERPDLLISSISGIGTLDLDSGPFALPNVRFVIENRSEARILTGVPLTYQVFLSRDDVLDLVQDFKLVQNFYTGGLAPRANVEIGPLTVDPSRLADGTSIFPNGGSYQLFVVVNRSDNSQQESRIDNNSLRTGLFLNRATAPERGLGFSSFATAAVGESLQWFEVSDSRASGGRAYQSPILPPNTRATLRYRITGPVTINAPWLLVPAPGDKLSVRVIGSGGATVFDALQNSYLPRNIQLTGPGEQEIEWIFQRGSSANSNGFARVDLNIPAFSATGDGEAAWVTAPDSGLRPDGTPGTVSTTISGANAGGLNTGEQASLETTLEGPGVVTFWWRLDNAAAADRLSLSVNGQPSFYPTYGIDDAAQPAAISGVTPWRKVAVLLRSGPQTLRWTYLQGSVQSGAQPRARPYLSTMQFTSPLPEGNLPNYTTDATRLRAVPSGNIDLAVTAGSVPPGTYLLDDAEGTGRLPVTVTVQNLGYRFAASTPWDTTQLQLILSPNLTLGDSDDNLLGDYAKLTSIVGEDTVTFQAEVNLPFDLAAGQYRVFARYARSGAEFTLANNTLNLGTVQIQRAPNLVIRRLLSSPANNFPWHPEDAVAVNYRIENTGLGTVLPSQPFKVRVQLISFECANPEAPFNVIKDYGETTFSVFLPERSASRPNGSSTDVSAFFDLPTLRDTLVALGAIPAGTPEDSREIDQEALEQLRESCFGFQFIVDSSRQVVESSETNLFPFDGRPFTIVAVDTFPTTIGSYFGDRIFGNILSGAEFLNNTTYGGSENFRRFVQAYALGMGLNSSAALLPVGSTQYAFFDALLTPTGYANGYPSITVPPMSSEQRLTLTFEFNALAEDVIIEVKAGSNLQNSDSWPTILKLEPPYNEATGPHSLTGFSGLKDQANVIAVDGNLTRVQKVWKPRVTVRDTEPLGAGSRFMRMVVSPVPNPPTAPFAPETFKGTFSNEGGASVVLKWTVPAGQPRNVTYLLERSLAEDPADFSAIGSTPHFNVRARVGSELPPNGVYTFIDRSVSSQTAYQYRIRAISTGGSTGYVGPVTVTVPN